MFKFFKYIHPLPLTVDSIETPLWFQLNSDLFKIVYFVDNILNYKFVQLDQGNKAIC